MSNTSDAGLCIKSLEDAIATHGTPEIFNVEQGNQFTGDDFTGILK